VDRKLGKKLLKFMLSLGFGIKAKQEGDKQEAYHCPNGKENPSGDYLFLIGPHDEMKMYRLNDSAQGKNLFNFCRQSKNLPVVNLNYL